MRKPFGLAISIALLGSASTAQAKPLSVSLDLVGRYHSGIFDEGGAEIVAHDPANQHVYVVNANDASVDVLNIANPASPTKIHSIDVSPLGGGANSVAVAPQRGLVAVAVENDDKQANGLVAFFATGTFAALGTVPAGPLPDMVTFTPDGKTVLVANEGEPDDDYAVDPEGSVTVIDVSRGVAAATVRTAGFGRWIGREDRLRRRGIRIFGPGANAAQDLEPEYIAVDPRGRVAYVACQENNALAFVNIKQARVTRIVSLGEKDHSLAHNALDASNKDDAIQLTTWPVTGLLLPDAIDAFSIRGRSYIITANEGDSRDYDGFSEEERVKDVTLDASAFPNAAELQADEALGRLKITTTLGRNAAGEFEQLFSYGGRSISIFDRAGRLVWDSGSQIAELVANELPAQFNSTNDDNDSFDNRSDDKGTEPEGVVVGKVEGHTLAFVGLERMGGVVVFDVSNPRRPELLSYVNPRDFSQDVCTARDGDGDCETGQGYSNPAAGDLGPEGLAFIAASESPTGVPLLVVGNEVSGTTSIFRIDAR